MGLTASPGSQLPRHDDLPPGTATAAPRPVICSPHAARPPDPRRIKLDQRRILQHDRAAIRSLRCRQQRRHPPRHPPPAARPRHPSVHSRQHRYHWLRHSAAPSAAGPDLPRRGRRRFGENRRQPPGQPHRLHDLVVITATNAPPRAPRSPLAPGSAGTAMLINCPHTSFSSAAIQPAAQMPPHRRYIRWLNSQHPRRRRRRRLHHASPFKPRRSSIRRQRRTPPTRPIARTVLPAPARRSSCPRPIRVDRRIPVVPPNSAGGRAQIVRPGVQPRTRKTWRRMLKLGQCPVELIARCARILIGPHGQKGVGRIAGGRAATARPCIARRAPTSWRSLNDATVSFNRSRPIWRARPAAMIMVQPTVASGLRAAAATSCIGSNSR